LALAPCWAAWEANARGRKTNRDNSGRKTRDIMSRQQRQPRVRVTPNAQANLFRKNVRLRGVSSADKPGAALTESGQGYCTRAPAGLAGRPAGVECTRNSAGHIGPPRDHLCDFARNRPHRITPASCPTSKMSHDHGRRAACDFTILGLWFHFDHSCDSTRRDGHGRWLWRLVSPSVASGVCHRLQHTQKNPPWRRA
jgi:hypothetical protein